MAPFARRPLLLALLSGLALSACLSPTLPLPPPSEPTVEEIGQGRYQLSGTIPQSGRTEVVAANRRTGFIFGQTVDAQRYSFSVDAEAGDGFDLWYTSGTEISGGVSFIIAEDALRLQLPSADAGDSGDGSQ